MDEKQKILIKELESISVLELKNLVDELEKVFANKQINIKEKNKKSIKKTIHNIKYLKK